MIMIIIIIQVSTPVHSPLLSPVVEKLPALPPLGARGLAYYMYITFASLYYTYYVICFFTLRLAYVYVAYHFTYLLHYITSIGILQV